MGMSEFLPELLKRIDRYIDLYEESLWEWELVDIDDGGDDGGGEPVPVPEEVEEKKAA